MIGILQSHLASGFAPDGKFDLSGDDTSGIVNKRSDQEYDEREIYNPWNA